MPPDPTAEQLISVGQQASRISIASILILFFAGALLLYLVKPQKDGNPTTAAG
jgi:hypothetical protein